MGGKKPKSGKVLLKEAGLEKTDNNFDLTSWAQVQAINQKNYYTEYLKREDQVLPLRLMQEERRDAMMDKSKSRDRMQARDGQDDDMGEDDEGDMNGEEDKAATSKNGTTPKGPPGSRTIIIHPGSQNLRIGLASDALPKTVPMVIAKQTRQTAVEEEPEARWPRRKQAPAGEMAIEPEEMFGQEFHHEYTRLMNNLKVHMRANKRRMLPNSKEVTINYNKRASPDTVPAHSDTFQVAWTELPLAASDAPRFICGQAALRIPETSNPRYKLHWPLKNGWLNEQDYTDRRTLYDDLATIIEQAVKNDLKLTRRQSWAQYGCIFVVPDLYERKYVTRVMDMLLREIGFGKVMFLQESLAATYGAGFISSCVIDVGAQKTSICCVEEGSCLDNSRINLTYGGADITDTFIRMLLYDYFPYADIDLRRRHDFLIAEELKIKHCSMNEQDISPQLFNFHVRVSGQDTLKYSFKTYDEVLLAPQGLLEPTIFNHKGKLDGRRTLIEDSKDLYDGSFNDPVSSAQNAVLSACAPVSMTAATSIDKSPQDTVMTGIENPSMPKVESNGKAECDDRLESPERDALGTISSSPAKPANNQESTVVENGETKSNGQVPEDVPAFYNVLPTMSLDQAVLTCVEHGARGDEKKTREFLSQIVLIGGGSQVPGFAAALEERLRIYRPGWAKDILVGTPPRELDAQVVVWKGGSVFAKLPSSGDIWITKLEYDRLGARVLTYKCMWAF